MKVSKSNAALSAIIAAITLLFSAQPVKPQPLASGHSKFLGNIVASTVPPSFNTYWNQISPENSGKWGSVESSRDNMDWQQLDAAYNHAQQYGFPFKQHTFVWGSQEPGWLATLSPSQQAAEVEEWIKAYCQRYPNTKFIDVVNEPFHAPASYRNAIGGDNGLYGTGWDWIVWSFEKARYYTQQYAPNAKLLINEYGIVSNPDLANDYVEIVNILKSRGLIDGIGVQAHCFNVDDTPASTIQEVLDILAATGLPIYVAELDMRGDDNTQLQRYQEKFPVMWNHPAVAGVTLWGYIEGKTWKEDTHLLRSNGTERPALQWLRDFLGGANTITIRAKGTDGTENISLTVAGEVVGSWTLSTSYQDYTASTDNSGQVTVQFTNDASGRDAQVDYIKVNGETHQAEDQAINTAVYQDGSCGGSYSELMHCNGYIDFGNVAGNGSATIVVRARGEDGSEQITLRVNNDPVASWTLSTGYQNYTATTTLQGGITVEFTNDGTDRDVQIDYIQVNGSTRQAEDQSYNTGVWQNSSCGGSNSEWLHCNGAIGFGDVTLSKQQEPKHTPTPKGFALNQNYPNPFNPATQISFQLAESGIVTLKIYNMLGQEIITLLDDVLPAGAHTVRWNAVGRFGQPAASGIYLYRMMVRTSNQVFIEQRRMMLIK